FHPVNSQRHSVLRLSEQIDFRLRERHGQQKTGDDEEQQQNPQPDAKADLGPYRKRLFDARLRLIIFLPVRRKLAVAQPADAAQVIGHHVNHALAVRFDVILPFETEHQAEVINFDHVGVGFGVYQQAAEALVKLYACDVGLEQFQLKRV